MSLIKAVTGGIWGYVIAASLGAALAGGGVFWIQGNRIEAAESRAKLAEQREGNAKFDLEQCAAASQVQSQAIAEVAARALRAKEAMDAADAKRQEAESYAQWILQQRTPADQDACTAARNDFADELRNERLK